MKGLIVSLWLVPALAWGEETPPEAPVAPVVPPAKAAPPDRFTWEPFGFLRLQYLMVQNDPNVAFVGRDDGFELQNARVGVRGNYEDRVSFVVSIDGAVDERTQINTTDGKLRVGLRDAFADAWLGYGIAARGGFFQTVIDPEEMVADTSRAFVDHPIESRGMRATEGFQTPTLLPGRSLGAAVRLDPKPDDAAPIQAGFELAVQNGADEYASNNDNDKPAVSAAVILRMPRDSWFTAGVRYNPRTVGELPFRQDEDDLQGSAGLTFNVGPVGLGGGFVFTHTSFPSTGGPSQNAFGGHAQLLVALPTSLPLAIGYRFGILDPSSLITTDRVMEHTAGAVLGVPRLRMRIQLQFTHVAEQAARELKNDRAQLAAEVSL